MYQFQGLLGIKISVSSVKW